MSKGSFSNDKVHDQHAAGQSAGAIVDLYVSVVLEQADFSAINGAEQLPAHQKTAKANAQTWRDTVRIALYQTNSNLIAFCNTFDALHKPLYQYAQKIADDPNDKQAKDSFVKGVNILLTKIQRNKSNCEDAAKKLKEFQAKVSSDHSTFQTDLKAVEATYEGDQGKLQALKARIESDRAAMSKDLNMIAGGSVMIVVGGLIVAVGVLAEIPSGGASTAVVVGGLAVAGGGATMVGIAAKDYDAKMDDLSESTRQLSLLTAEVTLAHSIMSQIQLLHESSKQALDALETMAKTWDVLQTDFKSVIDSVDQLDPSYGEYLQSLLDSAKTSWGSVAKTANIIHDQMIGMKVDTSAVDRNKPPVADKSSNVRLMTASLYAQPETYGATGSTSSTVAAVKTNLTAVTGGIDALRSLTGNVPAHAKPAEDLVSKLPALSGSVTQLLSTVESTASKSSTQLMAMKSLTGAEAVQSARTVFQDLTDALGSIHGSAQQTISISNGFVAQAESCVATFSSMSRQYSAQAESKYVRINEMRRTLYDLEEKLQRARAVELWSRVYFGDLAAQIANLITQKNRVESEFNRLVSELNSDQRQLSEAMKLHQWSGSMGIQVKGVATAGDRLSSSIQVLKSDFGSLTTAPDSVVEEFLTYQVDDLVNALRSIVGFHALRASRPSMMLMSSLGAAPLLNSSNTTFGATVTQLLGELATQTFMIGSAVSVISAQQDIKLPLVPTLSSDQSVLRNHALDWNMTYRLSLFQVFSAYSSGARTIQALVNQLCTLASKGNWEAAAKGIDIISNSVDRITTTVALSSSTVGLGLLSRVSDDVARFRNSELTMLQKYTGDTGRLSQLRSEIDSLDSTISENNKTIAQGATNAVLSALGSGVLIGLGVALSTVVLPVAAGASPAVVVFSGLFNAAFKAGTEAMKKKAHQTFMDQLGNDGGEAFLKQSAVDIEKYGKYISELKEDEAAVAVFSVCQQKVNQFKDSLSTSIELLEKLIVQQSRVGASSQVLLLKNAVSAKCVEDVNKQAEEIISDWKEIENAGAELLGSLVTSN